MARDKKIYIQCSLKLGTPSAVEFKDRFSRIAISQANQHLETYVNGLSTVRASEPCERGVSGSKERAGNYSPTAMEDQGCRALPGSRSDLENIDTRIS